MKIKRLALSGSFFLTSKYSFAILFDELMLVYTPYDQVRYELCPLAKGEKP